MADSPAQQKKLMRSTMERMKKKYGITKLPGKTPQLELVVYLVLREGWDYRKASRAVKILAEDFVDWNEVRVSTAGELTEHLGELSGRGLTERLARLLDALQDLYNEFNRIQLDFLFEQEFEDTRKAFERIEGLGRANAYLFLQALKDAMDEAPAKSSTTLVMGIDALRVGIRLGIIRKTGSLNVGRKEFTKLLDATEFYAFQNYFVRHAELYCLSQKPLCEDCFLSDRCNYFKDKP